MDTPFKIAKDANECRKSWILKSSNCARLLTSTQTLEIFEIGFIWPDLLKINGNPAISLCFKRTSKASLDRYIYRVLPDLLSGIFNVFDV